MNRKYNCNKVTLLMSVLAMLMLFSCSNKKNTSVTRLYHSVNTRYNIHFNANEAYKEALKSKEASEENNDNLSKLLYIYPEILDSADLKYGGNFTTTIDKTTKAIKLHSITTRPRRDPNKRADEKYRQWANQKEFNPFLANTWMLLAKSEFEEGSYLRAITTFMHVSNIYQHDKRMVSECKLWIARAYSEMGWRYEAENVLRKMEQNDEIHHQLFGMYSAIKANLYIHNNDYKSAIPFLGEAIRKEKSGNIKRRQKYLLAQLYAETGDKSKAYKAFGEARGLTTPYKYTIGSKLRQVELSDMTQKEMISSLNKLTKGAKNEEYLDQVYTAIGDVYLNNIDTASAITNYHKAIDKSLKSGYDKALAQIKLGAVYYKQREYIKAQPCYSEALPQLRKEDEHYPIVSFRSEVLDKLVVHAKVVHEQDSLLLLANMPEEERLNVIKIHIEKLKKEEEAQKQQEQIDASRNDTQVTGWGDLGGWNQASAAANDLMSEEVLGFYFYNPKTVDQGKVSFQRQWGRRSLEDNWRRKNKNTSSSFDDELLTDDSQEPEDGSLDPQTGERSGEATSESADVYSVEYYLQQLPLTEEAKQESYKLIENGLFNMGLIYKDLMEDDQLAIETFNEDLNRFADTPNREEIYYQLFLIYLKIDNQEMTAMYRDKLVEEFAEGKYAVPLGDPNYAWNFTYMSKLQEDLYQQAYAAYLAGDAKTVRKIYTDVQTKFPFVDLIPKFAFLNSLSYAFTKDARSMEKYLTELVDKYPQADVTPLATNILKNIRDGKIILADGTPITSMDWTMAYSNDSIFGGEEARVIEYTTGLDKPYSLLLMFKPRTIDRNDLLYEVADYNFSNYVVQTFDLAFHEDEVLSSLEIKGFADFKAIRSYLNKSMEEDGLLTKIDSQIIPVPISASNYADIFPRLGLEQYMVFYTDSLAVETPNLLTYWGDEREMLPVIKKEVQEEKELAQTEVIEAELEPIVSETKEEKIAPPVETSKSEDKKPVDKEKDKEASQENVLTKEQEQTTGTVEKKVDELAAAISKVGSNPVDGLKNIFSRDKLEENLTKEEKEELKHQRKEEVQQQKEQTRIEKVREDSIKRIDKAISDSIQTVREEEKQRVVSERKERERQQKEQAEERKRQMREKEDTRDQLLKDREDRRKQQEREREELQRQRERERDKMIKEREEERKKKEREADELRKQRERERQEQLKQQEAKRRQKK